MQFNVNDMDQLVDKEAFLGAKLSEMIKFVCNGCDIEHEVTKKTFVLSINRQKKANIEYPQKFCTSSCFKNYTSRSKTKSFECKTCSELVFKTPSELQKSKSGNVFCSSSCAATFNNSKKTRRPWNADQRSKFSETKTTQIANGDVAAPPSMKGKKWSDERKAMQSSACVKRKNDVATNCTKEVICWSCEKPFKTTGKYKQCWGCRTNITPVVSCKFCNTAFIRPKSSQITFCSKECRKTSASICSTERLKKFNYRYQLKGKASYLERSFREWLEGKGIEEGLNGFLTEIHFYNKQNKRHGYCDFVFPRAKTIVELDGTTHRNTIEKDKTRDEHLASRGWTTLRITHKEYKNKTKLNEVLKILDAVIHKNRK